MRCTMATKILGPSSRGLGALASIVMAVGCSSDPGPAPGSTAQPAPLAATSEPAPTSEPPPVIIPHVGSLDGLTQARGGRLDRATRARDAVEIADWEGIVHRDATRT